MTRGNPYLPVPASSRLCAPVRRRVFRCELKPTYPELELELELGRELELEPELEPELELELELELGTGVEVVGGRWLYLSLRV